MFLYGGDDERYAAMTTNRAAAIRYVSDQEKLAKSIESIRRAISSGKTVDPFPGIKRGRRCRVRSGALKGLEGVVLRRTKIARVYVVVDALGQSVELEIEADLLELVD
jgi:transcription antitermination factor NusG